MAQSYETDGPFRGRSAKDWQSQRGQEIRQALDAIYLSQLKTISLVMVIYYLITTLGHLFFLPPEIKVSVTTVAATALLVCILLHFSVRLGFIAARHSHVALLPPGILAVILVYFHVWSAADVHQMTNGVLMVLAFGFVTLLPWVYISLTLFSVVCYTASLIHLGGEYMVHYAFMGGAGLLLSAMCFLQRYRTLINVEDLLISNRMKSEALAVREREAQRLLLEANEAATAARRANEAKGVFLANTTHELRTPLTGVLGMIQLLAETKLTKAQLELVNAAQFSANTLLTLINDILDLAKLDEGKLVLSPHPFCPREVTGQIVDLLRPQAEQKGLAFVFEDDRGKAPTLLGDSVRIGQVLFNLIGNAIKFTEKGRVTVSLTMIPPSSHASARYSLKFAVEDTGVGFAPETAANLFKRFEQADGTAVKRQGGTGLGLAISQELAQMMDGRITADSSPGRGSRFVFEVALPVAAEHSAKAETEGPGKDKGERRMLSILIAEDNKVNQVLIKKMLSRDDIELTLVEDGKRAVEAVLENDFDVVLMDVRMPEMDGVDATRAIRKAAGPRAKTPIIALTANTMAEDIAAYKDAGMAAVVGKPINPVELMAAIEQAAMIYIGKEASPC